MRFAQTCLLCLIVMLIAGSSWAIGPDLVWIERLSDQDRTTLLQAEIPLTTEFSSGFCAAGESHLLRSKLSRLGYQSSVLDTNISLKYYYIAFNREPVLNPFQRRCGEIIWEAENWIIIRTSEQLGSTCLQLTTWTVTPLPFELLQIPQAPPAEYQLFRDGKFHALATDPMVQTMVDNLSSSTITTYWSDIVHVATTRYSTSSGCQTAAEFVYNRLQGYGLETTYQSHTSGHAPNVIATIEGKINPDDVYIVIGHLDDMPSSGPAPGADDNASGSANVMVLAEIMSNYSFENTVKFLVVTGEEFGLYGSSAYANAAAASGENIQAVLNADMTAWAGDGSPNPENLDLNYNGTSDWLGTLFAQLATDYGTGCTVDAFLCPSMTASDHAPFWSKGWSAVCGITDNGGTCGHNGFNPYYHSSDDTIANCGDPTFYISTVKAYLSTLAHLAKPLCYNPDPPSNVTAVAAGPNQINVSWTPIGLGYTYEIYRAPGGCSSPYPFYYVGQTNTNSYSDTTASGQINYGYQVYSRDPTGYCLSEASTCVEASTVGDCLEPPVFEGLSEVIDGQGPNCSLSLSWPNALHQFCGTEVVFNVYRSTDPQFIPSDSNRLAQCLTGNSFSDMSVEWGIDYTYIVRAEDNAPSGSGPCGGNEDRNTIRLTNSPTGSVTVFFADDFENGLTNWTAQSPWGLSTQQHHSGANSAHGGNVSNTCALLTLQNELLLPSQGNASLTFWIYYYCEATYDGAQVQLSTDGGTSWNLLVPEGGYPGTASATCSAKQGNLCYSGQATTWSQQTVNLDPYRGEDILIRFVMASDYYYDQGGFYVDDVQILFADPCQSGVVPTLNWMTILVIMASFGIFMRFRKNKLFFRIK